jgi:hypothetical protein
LLFDQSLESGLKHGKVPSQVRADDRIEVIFSQLGKRSMAQDSCAAHGAVEPSPRVQARRYRGLGAGHSCDALAVRDGLSAAREYFVNGLLRDSRCSVTSTNGGTDIRDDNPASSRCNAVGYRSSYTATAARHDNHLSV